MTITVVKRDGTSEEFNPDKVITSITKCGVPLKESEEEAGEVQNWIISLGSDKISSMEIKDKIIQDLTGNFPAEMDSFNAFKK